MNAANNRKEHDTPILSEEIVTTLTSSSGIELIGEAGELMIDQLITSEVLKEIPFVGWIAKAAGIYNSISDRIFFNKLLRFLGALEELGSDEKADFVKHASSDANFRKRIGESLVMAVDQIDDMGKAGVLAKCFDQLLLGLIDEGEFQSLSYLLARAPMRAIDSLSQIYEPWEDEYEELFAAGMARAKVYTPTNEFEETSLKYSLSYEAKVLAHILRGTWAEEKERRKKARTWLELREIGPNPFPEKPIFERYSKPPSR